MTKQKIPPGLRVAGTRLLEAVLADYDLDEHEQLLLIQAARVADTCDELQAIVDRDGLIAAGARRVHPGAIELRNQRILLARLITSLRVPLGDQEQPSKTGAPRLQRRPVRGFRVVS